MTTELLSAAEAARILGVPRSRVVDLADTDPAFPAFQPSPAGGRAWPRAAVEAWAAAHPDRGPLHRGPTLPEVGGRSPQLWTVANLAGQPVHAVFDEQGQEVLDEDGRPLIVPVEIPDGSSVEAPAPHT